MTCQTVINLIFLSSVFIMSSLGAHYENIFTLENLKTTTNDNLIEKYDNTPYLTFLHFNNTHRGRRFIPFARPINEVKGNITEDCLGPDEDFPKFLTEERTVRGGVVLCFIIGIYCFTLLAIVCDKYFLPTVEMICVVLDLSPDVAAATFMSVATSCPELFTNIIGTFVTESDIGIGTIVGSSMFNALGVAAIGGLTARKPLKLDWWPVTRDVLIYILAVSLLVVIVWDSIIRWYEGLTLFVVYFIYFTVMFQNRRIEKLVKGFLNRNKVVDVTKTPPETIKDKNLNILKLEAAKEKEGPHKLRVSIISAYGSYMEDLHVPNEEDVKIYKEINEEEKKDSDSIFQMPTEGLWKKLYFYYTWPIKLVLLCTIPNPKNHPKLYPLSFFMCIIWIGTNSYMVSWMISIIGTVFSIPAAVLGLTFLAAGGSLPESISMAIMSRRGEGSMGVSNSLGANTMNILLSLGMPWFFKTIIQGANSNSFIQVQSGSIEYTILALVVVAVILYVTLWLNKFRLSRLTGSILLCIHLTCIVLAVLSEMVFFPTNNC